MNGTARFLIDQPWVGNVRELRNALERAVILEKGPSIGLQALSLGGANAASLEASGAWSSPSFRTACR